jgi:hypothetical protein
MIIIRDNARIARLARRSQQVSLLGLVTLLGGLILAFMSITNLLLIQTGTLLVGFALSQYGAYLAHRYGRTPRPDEVLDDEIKPLAREGRMYHYVLPAPHVLLLPDGPVVINLKFQGGRIYAEGDRWRQKGLGLRRIFGQESLGNPTKETDAMISAIARYLRTEAPAVADKEIPIAAMIVFTSKSLAELDVERSSFPAMHVSKIRGFLRQKGHGKPLPPADYAAIREAFDKAAAGLL